jgi:hypothetical protein
MAGFGDTVFNWLAKFRKPDGTFSDAQCDANGNLKVAVVDAAAAIVTTWIDPPFADELSATAQNWATTPRKLHQVVVSNFGAADTTFMLFDAAAAVTNGNPPVFAWPMPARTAVTFELPRARQFTTGIWWAASTTNDTLTIDNAGVLRVSLEVE